MAMAAEKRYDVVEFREDVLGGAYVFVGTRVPARALFDYLIAGDRLEDFLRDYPSVTRDQAESYLAHAADVMLEDDARTAR